MDPDQFKTLLPSGFDGVLLSSVDSTNSEARRRSGNLEDINGLWIVARQQTAGRGRNGRVWSSLDGNLFCSLLLPGGGMIPARGVELGFLASIAVADALRTFTKKKDADVSLKWPNDVLVNGKKVAGLLLESVGGAGGLQYIIIGIGVNCRAAPKDARYPATSLKDAWRVNIDPIDLFAEIADKIANWLHIWREEGFLPIRKAWMEQGPKSGTLLRVDTGEGNLEGAYGGLDESGGLILMTEYGQRIISSGDVDAMQVID